MTAKLLFPYFYTFKLGSKTKAGLFPPSRASSLSAQRSLPWHTCKSSNNVLLVPDFPSAFCLVVCTGALPNPHSLPTAKASGQYQTQHLTPQNLKEAAGVGIHKHSTKGRAEGGQWPLFLQVSTWCKVLVRCQHAVAAIKGALTIYSTAFYQQKAILGHHLSPIRKVSWSTCKFFI